MVTDKNPAAIKELQECACQNGGHAIVYFGDSESGIHGGFGYSQQHIKARASVLYVYPKKRCTALVSINSLAIATGVQCDMPERS